MSAQIKIDVLLGDGSRHVIQPDVEHSVAAQSKGVMALCYLNTAQAVMPGKAIVTTCTVAYADVFSQLDSAEGRFAGLPSEWERGKWKKLARGLDIASYLRTPGLGGDGVEEQ